MEIRNLCGCITGGLLLLFASCASTVGEQDLPVIMEIKTGWEFRTAGTGDWLKAEVPGTVHTDLLRHGTIEDPFYRMNEDKVRWIEDQDWEYRTTFDVSRGILAKNEVELDFRGLDTYADVFLNGHMILRADNMFLGWRVSCREHLSEGVNELRVVFRSPVREGMNRLQRLDYPVPAVNEQAPEGERTNVFTRKAPFHYGWDWGPRLVTSGIWRPVLLHAWSYARIGEVYLETVSIGNERAEIIADVDIISLEPGDLVLSLYINGRPSGIKRKLSLERGMNRVRLDIGMENPRLWWTNGLGEPYLYDFSFRLEAGSSMVDRYDLDYGIRTVELVQEEDDHGHSFRFEVNGMPVFMKGANVIPSHILTPAVTGEMHENLVKNAVDANMNMLRVWGGAIYGDDTFYRLCDRNGILVWQDFMFSCALQPGDEKHLENIRREAEYNVRRLRNHASLALWCGNNEILHGWHHWGWQDLYTPEQRDFMWQTYERIFHDILAGVVADHDPKNPYWSSSPSSIGNMPADRKSGDEHDWTIWFGRQPFSNYANDVPRFVSEWGFQSFPAMSTIEGFTAPEDRHTGSDVLRHRQRSRMTWISPGFDGTDMISWYMEMYYRMPGEFESFIYLSQLLQAKGYKTAIESHRRSMPACMGSLYWQLNDCWPAISWSTVDYHNRWKAAHYAVREAFADIIISPAIEGDTINIYVISDLRESLEADVRLRLLDFGGAVLWSDEKRIIAGANTSTLVMGIAEPSLPAGDRPGSIVLVSDILVDGEVAATNNLYFAAPRFLDLPDAVIDINIKKVEGYYLVELSSDRLVRNVYLQADDADAFFSDNFFDLLPGSIKTVRLTTVADIEDSSDIRLISLNQLLHAN